MAADIFSEEQRSYVMSRVGSKNTKPELIVRSFLHGLGFRFRIHEQKLPGCPDIVLPKHRCVVFVNGCFWHRHKDCRRASMPLTRVDFWQTKFDGNIARDEKNQRLLKKNKWKVCLVWECEIDKESRRAEKLLELANEIIQPLDI
ncbi:MAG: very short patch repair endonuclease [Verrucomicrobia bacterium]|nr:DNA mismatch endonuclease Vsr [Verrucomicrobiota bacterium]MDA0725689.1 very short patch repair endonuclease [Verrucomicrobiota bacterium]MDA1048771.1 very short patch repair endonuclease [Verrucomicrobiota bacterium]